MTTLLLTGAGGFLGSHILQAALRRSNDLNVIVVDSFRHNGGTDRILEAMADMPGTIGDSQGQILDDTRRRVRLLTHDLTAPMTRWQVGQFGKVDYIVHAAARCSVDDSIQDPLGHVRNNVDSTLEMLELARRLEVERYLQVSTDEVFGPWAFRDEEQHNPSSPYAASKAACEDLVQAWSRTYSVPATIVNSANLFGERQSGLAFIPQVIKRVQEHRTVTIHTQNGEPAWRWYTYAPNVAAWVINYLSSSDPLNRHVLSGQLGINVLRLAQEIADLLDGELRYDESPGLLDRPGFDGQYPKLPIDDSWRPEIPAAEGLENTVKWYAERPGWID